MSMVTVDVDVDLGDFDDDDLLAEVKERGLLNNPDSSADLVEIAKENSIATVIEIGVCEAYEIVIGGKTAFNSSGRATIIILDGE
jgi:hypothetical protein